MNYAAIHIAEFPVAAWLRAEPEQKPNRLSVLEGEAPHEHVVALNAAAKATGIERGMSKVQAEATGAPRFRTRDLTQEQQAFLALMEVVEKFSPAVQAVRSPTNSYGNDARLAAALLLDCTGMETLFGPLEAYARQLHEALLQAGCPSSIAIAPNAEAALLLCRSYSRVLCVKQSELQLRLAPLPMSCLPCTEATLATFHRWGIATLGDLARLPEMALISRIGQQAHRLRQLALGTADHLLVPEEEAFTLCENAVLDTPVEILDSLLFVLSPLLEAIVQKAVDHACSVRSLHLQLQLERAEPHAVQVRPAIPTQSRDLLLKLLNLELQAHPPQSGIVAVALSAEAAQPQRAQRGLFQSQFPEPERLDLLLARLRSIAGEENVGSPRLLNSHRDDVFQMVPFQPHTKPAAEDAILPGRLALRAFRPVQQVRVDLWANQPHMLFWNGTNLAVQTAVGPWHTSGSWWDGNAWDTDEWDVVLAASQQPTQLQQTVRLQQQHASGTWYLLGIYD